MISNAIIYKPAAVQRTGEARALGTQSAEGQAFGNAREPIAQVFTPVDGAPFLFVMNHFKSKGSAGPWPGDVDTGDGQGASNESRVRQATALRDWVADVKGPATAVALVGDFNSYRQGRSAAGALRRRLRRRGKPVRPRQVLLLVLRPVRIARSHPAQRRSRAAVDRRGHLEHQLRRIRCAAIQPVQQPRHAVLRRFAVRLLGPRPGGPRTGARHAAACGAGRPDVAEHQRLPRPDRRQHGEVRRDRRSRTCCRAVRRRRRGAAGRRRQHRRLAVRLLGGRRTSRPSTSSTPCSSRLLRSATTNSTRASTT